MIKALILDFDGLILDTETSDFEAWRVVYQDHGVSLPRDEWAKGIGGHIKAFDPVTRLAQLTGRPVVPAAIWNARRQVCDALLERLEPLPGVLAWLEEAAKQSIPVAIASSSPRSWVEWHLERTELRHYFAELVTAELVTRVKPDPALYHAALSILGVGPYQALAVEDSPNGVAAARAADLKCVAVPGPMTAGCDFQRASLRLNSLSERSLAAVTRELFAA